MAERALGKDRLLPCLLDRLTDHYPRARKEGRTHRAVTLRQYRDSVLRDLKWLLNSTCHPRNETLSEFEQVRTSVLNYGVRSLSGVWASHRSAMDIERQVREAILRFEPRIVPSTLAVKLVVTEENSKHSRGVIALEIVGQLWAEPVPEQLFIRTEVDVETGECAFG